MNSIQSQTAQCGTVLQARTKGRPGALLPAAFLILLTLALYFPATRAGFIWDDDTHLTDHILTRPGGLRDIWLMSPKQPNYWPVTWTSLWVEWQLWGAEVPRGYHTVNILLHTLNALLIWRVLRHLAVPGAWLAALIFAVHPVNVETAAWVTQRKNLLAMFFYLLAIRAYLHYEDEARRRWYALALATFLLALLSKTSVVMLPVVLLLCAWWRRGRIMRGDLWRTTPFFALALALSLVEIAFQYRSVRAEPGVHPEVLPARLAGMGWAVWFYLGKVVIPQGLCFVYPRWQIDAASPWSYLPGLLFLGCLLLAWRYRAGWGHPVLFALGYVVVTLFPVLGLFSIYFMRYSLVADHWQYVSMIGIVSLFVGAVTTVMRTWRGPQQWRVMTAAGLAILSLALLTWRQQDIYQDEGALWRDTLRRNPRAWMAHTNFSAHLAPRGRAAEAIVHCDLALRLNPRDAQAYNNRGFAWSRLGEHERAIADYTTALALSPNTPEIYNNRALAHFERKDFDAAIADCHNALRLRPDFASVYNGLAIAHFAKGNYDQAWASLREYVRLGGKPHPGFIEALSRASEHQPSP